MTRRFTEEEWEAGAAKRRRLAEQLGFVQRSPLRQQPGKSSVKKAILKSIYGEYGQPFPRSK
jgi:hypothetical protein